MKKKKLADILCAIVDICLMTAAFWSAKGASVSVQTLLIGLTGIAWFISGYLWG